MHEPFSGLSVAFHQYLDSRVASVSDITVQAVLYGRPVHKWPEANTLNDAGNFDFQTQGSNTFSMGTLIDKSENQTVNLFREGLEILIATGFT